MNNEISKFNNRALNWWDKDDGEERLPHFMSGRRMQYIKKIINTYLGSKINLKDLSFLDFGCGVGVFSEEISKIGCDVIAIDLGKELIKIAKEHCEYLINKPKYFDSTESVDIELRKRDIIISFDVAEHVDDLNLYVKQLISFVKNENSIIILSTINKSLLSYFVSIFLAENLGYVTKGTHKWSKFVKPSDLIKIFAKYNFQKIDIEGLSFNPIKYKFNFTKSLANQYFISFQLKK